MYHFGIFSFFISISVVTSIYCNVGYGQRGREYEYGQSWTRYCPNSDYCWETSTANLNDVSPLFDFPWDNYYYQFYVSACGGDWGAPLTNPYVLSVNSHGKARMMPKKDRKNLRFNVTVPPSVLTRGGSCEMKVTNICTKNYCKHHSVSVSAAPSQFAFNWRASLCIGVLVMIVTVIM